MAEVREKLQQCKQLLHCRQDELRSLWVEGIEHKQTMQECVQLRHDQSILFYYNIFNFCNQRGSILL